MVKYFKELEKPNDFCLHLVERFYMSGKEIRQPNVPVEFFNKYSKLFAIMNDLYYVAKNIDVDATIKKITDNYHLGLISYEQLGFISSLETLIYEKFSHVKESQKSIVLSSWDIECIFRFYRDFTRVLDVVYLERKNEFESIREYIEKALKELEKSSTIKYDVDRKREIKLPNAWYITCYNDLYNTADLDGAGHKQANLVYPMMEISRDIYANERINASEYYQEKRKRILNGNYITMGEFQNYLNFIYYPTSLINDKNNKNIDITYNPNVVKSVLGIISAHAGLYRFFEDLQKYTDNPVYEFEKIMEMTSEDINDILVRCAGFHKMAVCQTNTIATSQPYCGTEFSEYLKRGWDVSYQPPIIINKEKRIVEELNSIIVDRNIEKDRENYEKKKQLGYGKIFLNEC